MLWSIAHGLSPCLLVYETRLAVSELPIAHGVAPCLLVYRPTLIWPARDEPTRRKAGIQEPAPVFRYLFLWRTIRCLSIFHSRSFAVARLSWACLPLARAI